MPLLAVFDPHEPRHVQIFASLERVKWFIEQGRCPSAYMKVQVKECASYEAAMAWLEEQFHKTVSQQQTPGHATEKYIPIYKFADDVNPRKPRKTDVTVVAAGFESFANRMSFL